MATSAHFMTTKQLKSKKNWKENLQEQNQIYEWMRKRGGKTSDQASYLSKMKRHDFFRTGEFSRNHFTSICLVNVINLAKIRPWDLEYQLTMKLKQVGDGIQQKKH